MEYLIKRPMFFCAVVSSIVSIAGFYSKTALFLIGIGVIIVLSVTFYKRMSVYLIVWFLVLITVFSAFLQLAEIEKIKYFSGNECRGEYIVVTEPVARGDYYSVTVEVERSEILKKGTKIDVIYSEQGVGYSDIIMSDITIKSIEDSEYKSMNYSEKIYCNGYMKNIENTGKKDFVLKKLGGLRKYIKTKIFKNFEFNESATALALITSDKSYFSDAFYSNVKASGVAHVMVVSGMHLSIIVAFLLFFVQKFFYNRYLRALITFIAVLTVAAVCGFTMSILRAGVTYILISVSLFFNKSNTPSNTLGAAVSLILINNPLAIFNVAFQLSVLSTFGILAVAAPVTEFVKEKEYIKNKFLFNTFCAIVISLSATVLTLPVAIYRFGYISNVFIITNLLICTPATVALCLTVLGFIIIPFEKVFFILSGIIIKYINTVINYFGSLSFSVTYLDEWSVYVAIAVIIILLYGLVTCKRRINMLKLNEINNKRIQEGGKKVKWQSFMRKP